MMKSSRDYPEFRVLNFEDLTPLRLLATLLLYLIAFSLAHLYFFFAGKPGFVDYALTEWTLDPYASEFFVNWAIFLGIGTAYAAIFGYLGGRLHPELDWGRTLRLIAPGLAGTLLYVLFVYTGSPNFPGSVASYILKIMPWVLAIVWPIWTLKIFRGMGWEEWGPRGRTILVGVLFVLMGWFFTNATGAAVRKWWVMEHNLQDMGLYVQMVWGGTQGRLLYNTGYRLPGDSFLNGEHAIFTTMVLTPLGYLPDIPLGLVLAQTVLFLISAWLVAMIARQYSQIPWVPPFMAMLFLMTPWVERAMLDDFHIDAFEVPLLLGCWWVAVAWTSPLRVPMFLLLLLMLVGCKEDAGLTAGMMGLALMLQRRSRWLGLVAFVGGPLATYVVLSQVMPANVHFGKYDHFGSNKYEIAATLLTRPDIVLSELWLDERRLSIARLLLCFGLLPLLAPEIWLILSAPVVTTLLSNWDKQYKLETHYGLDFLAPLTLAAIVGWGRIESLTAFLTGCTASEDTLDSREERRTLFRSRGGDMADSERLWDQNRSEFVWRMSVLAMAVFAMSAYVHHEYTKHSAFKPLEWLSTMRSDPRDADFHEQVVAYIDPAEGLLTQNDLGSVFGNRWYIGGFPPPRDAEGRLMLERVDAVLVDARGDIDWAQGRTGELVDELITSEGFEVHHYFKGYLIVRRGESPLEEEAQSEALADFHRILAGRR